jgi:hypothetical protein
VQAVLAVTAPQTPAGGATSDQVPPAAHTSPAAPCGCPQHPGRSISDPAAHAAWHALVVEQGGPAGRVDVETLKEERDLAVAPAPDAAARKQALSRIRRRAIAVIS